ncbi:MAG: acylphosphatase [Rhodobacteraceae bacterium]|nr:acylphosphatase [Paracoccaceae bacterium]
MSFAKIEFYGTFDTRHFCDWIGHRAHKLGLTGRIEAASSERITLYVQGQEELLNAMEVACSLGPIDADVSHTNLVFIDPADASDWPNRFQIDVGPEVLADRR